MNPVIARAKTLFVDWLDAMLVPFASIVAELMLGSPLWLCLVFAVGLWLIQSGVVMLIQLGLPSSLRTGIRPCFALGPVFIIESVFCILALAGTDPDNQPISEHVGFHDNAQDAHKTLTAALSSKQRQRLSAQLQTLQCLIDRAPDSIGLKRPTASRRMPFSERLSSRRSLHEIGGGKCR